MQEQLKVVKFKVRIFYTKYKLPSPPPIIVNYLNSYIHMYVLDYVATLVWTVLGRDWLSNGIATERKHIRTYNQDMEKYHQDWTKCNWIGPNTIRIYRTCGDSQYTCRVKKNSLPTLQLRTPQLRTPELRTLELQAPEL